MTRKRARKILMSIGTSRNHANWGADGKATLEDKCRCGRGYADNHPVREAAAEENGRGQNNGGIRIPCGRDEGK